jgi:hypothetical protein
MRRCGIFVAIVFIINAIGWIILLAVVKNQHARYFACFCITVGGYAAIPLMMSWTGKCHPDHPRGREGGDRRTPGLGQKDWQEVP